MANLRAALMVLLAALSARPASALEASSRKHALETEVARIAAGAGGRVGVAVVHVESGEAVASKGGVTLPMYSVFKLPLAVIVLKDVESARLRLDQPITITAAEVSPGSAANAERWQTLPATFTVRQLLEFSLIDSDNTSSDKLLDLVGGPATVTKRLRALKVDGIAIRASGRDMAGRRDHPNRSTARALTTFLVALQRGQILQPAEQTLLWNMMGRSRTGIRRLRGSLPAGTAVVDKTGTGKDGIATNDVGIITLPGNQGHLAMAVLISGSKLPIEEQEHIIAALARAAFDSHVKSSAAALGTAPSTVR